MGVVLHFPPCFSFKKQPKLGLGNPTCSVRDWSSSFATRKAAPSLLITSSIRSDGNQGGRPRRKSSASGRRKEENQDKKSSDARLPKSSKREEIISLFKRIQSSISKRESVSVKESNSKPSRKKPVAGSVLDVLRQSRKDMADRSVKKEGENKLKWRRGDLRKQQQAPNTELDVDFKLSRPPSNFVKRSPIPFLSPPRGKALELKGKSTSDTAKNEDLGAIGNMKLTELKELAKARGIKGYSRLKKSELVELLRSSAPCSP